VTDAGGVPWLVEYAGRKGFRYSAEADERWLRAWEPYATLRVPLRYEHVLESTGEVGSLTIARLVVESGAAAWIAIAQDTRVKGRAALTSDARSPFREPLDLVTLPRRTTGDPAFDAAFASFAPSAGELADAVSPRTRRLALSWQTPAHVEVRPGGFVMAPVALAADPASLSWLVRAVYALGSGGGAA
jgi:hypothetical protein